MSIKLNNQWIKWRNYNNLKFFKKVIIKRINACKVKVLRIEWLIKLNNYKDAVQI